MPEGSAPQDPLSVATELDDLLVEDESPRRQSRKQAAKASDETSRRWHNPTFQYQLDDYALVLDPSRIADEPREAFLGNLDRKRRRLRKTLEEKQARLAELLQGLESAPAHEGETSFWHEHRNALVKLERRWGRLVRSLGDGSAYTHDLVHQASRRWEDATRASNPWTLVTCALAAMGWLVLTLFLYVKGFIHTVDAWRPAPVPWPQVQEAVLYTVDPGWLALLSVAVLVLSALAYRWLSGSAIKGSARKLQDHVKQLADYASLTVPPRAAELPQVRRHGAGIAPYGLPSLRMVLQPQFAVVVVIALVLTAPSWYLGNSRARYQVLAKVNDCNSFEALVVRQDADRIVFLADLDRWHGGQRLGTLILPQRYVDAMVQVPDGSVPSELLCPQAIAAEPPETETDLTSVVFSDPELTSALADLGNQLVTASNQQGVATRRSIDQLGVALADLGQDVSEATTTQHDIAVRLIEGMPKPPDLAPLETAIKTGFEASHEQQTEMIEALNAGTERSQEMNRIARLALCQDVRNSIGKTWRTLFPKLREKYISGLPEACDTTYENLTANPETAAKEEDGSETTQAAANAYDQAATF